MNVINLEEYTDKVAGCWMGKNIGGTLGAPFEGRRYTHDLKFYSQDLSGAPAPNDDLDLQLIWFHAIKKHGLENITPALLGEYWLGNINGPWNEYAVGKANMRAGLMPPLSGSCNNDTWKYSNGAWIRSEIWACCFPGNPDEAIKYAYMDSCVDHCGEGIYAEMFTAALEAAAFIVGDINKLIGIALSKIPENCRVVRSVKIVLDGYKKGKKWLEVREELVRDSADLGWFQAPANIGFTVLGLVYGEGDFGRTICLAVNCGDDTDCTGATSGAIMGIIMGRKAIPEKWVEPIGESIRNVCINCFLRVPKTLGELTSQVVDEAVKYHRNLAEYPVKLGDAPTSVSKEWHKQLQDNGAAAELWALPPYEMPFDLPHIQVCIDYLDGSQIATGVEKKIKIKVKSRYEMYEHFVTLDWRLPEDWQITPGRKSCFYTGLSPAECEMTIIPGELDGGFRYVELEVKDSKRMNPYILTVPFQCGGAVKFSKN